MSTSNVRLIISYSESGLVVAAVGVANGWLNGHWLAVIAIALSLTCAVAASLNVVAHRFYARHRTTWKRLERSERLADARPLDIRGAAIAVIGMGRIGSGAYDTMHRLHTGAVVGVVMGMAAPGLDTWLRDFSRTAGPGSPPLREATCGAGREGGR